MNVIIVNEEKKLSQYNYPKPTSSVKKWKTIFALFLLFSAILSNDIALSWIHERVPYNAAPLPDVFFSLVPEYQPAIKVTEVLILVSLTLTFSTMFLHRHRWIVARRIFVVATTCYFMRAICVSVTQVPVPSKNTYCAPPVNETTVLLLVKRVARTMSTFGLDLYNRRVLCGDLIFSGHTTVLVLSSMAVSRYLPTNVRWLSYVPKLAAIVGPICILIARKHYTLDVLLAFIITPVSFSLYHQIIEGKKSSNRSVSSSDFWRWFILWMESDVDDVIENKFSFPCGSRKRNNMYYVI